MTTGKSTYRFDLRRGHWRKHDKNAGRSMAVLSRPDLAHKRRLFQCSKFKLE